MHVHRQMPAPEQGRPVGKGGHGREKAGFSFSPFTGRRCRQADEGRRQLQTFAPPLTCLPASSPRKRGEGHLIRRGQPPDGELDQIPRPHRTSFRSRSSRPAWEALEPFLGLEPRVRARLRTKVSRRKPSRGMRARSARLWSSLFFRPSSGGLAGVRTKQLLAQQRMTPKPDFGKDHAQNQSDLTLSLKRLGIAPGKDESFVDSPPRNRRRRFGTT